MKITNAWDFLPPTTRTLRLSFPLSSYLIPIFSVLCLLFPIFFFFILCHSDSFFQTPLPLSCSNCPFHSAIQSALCSKVDDALLSQILKCKTSIQAWNSVLLCLDVCLTYNHNKENWDVGNGVAKYKSAIMIGFVSKWLLISNINVTKMFSVCTSIACCDFNLPARKERH